MKMIWGWSGKEATMEVIKDCVGEGWSEILDDLVRDLETLGWDGTVYQVKEKFGGLRFYIGDGGDEIWERIRKAEEESIKTCEDCGADGKRRGGSWIRTLCEECQQKAQTGGETWG